MKLSGYSKLKGALCMSSLFKLSKDSIDIVLYNGKKLLSDCASMHDCDGSSFLWIRDKILTIAPLLFDRNCSDEQQEENIEIQSDSLKMNFKKVKEKIEFKMKIRSIPEPYFDLYDQNKKYNVNENNYFKFIEKTFFRIISRNQENSMIIKSNTKINKNDLSAFYLKNRLELSALAEESNETILRHLINKKYHLVKEGSINYQCRCDKQSMISWINYQLDNVTLAFKNSNTQCLMVKCDYCIQDFYLFRDDFESIYKQA